MTMDPGEIVREYNSAKCKSKQIGILAELNMCTKEEIKEILVENGVEGVKVRYSAHRKKPVPDEKQGKEEEKTEARSAEAEQCSIGQEAAQEAKVNKDEQSNTRQEPISQKAEKKLARKSDRKIYTGLFSMGQSESKLPDEMRSFLTEQSIFLSERIEHDTKRLRAINELIEVYSER